MWRAATDGKRRRTAYVIDGGETCTVTTHHNRPLAEKTHTGSPVSVPLSISTWALLPYTSAADVCLHVNGCVFPLHLSVLKERCRMLYKKILLLRTTKPAAGRAETERYGSRLADNHLNYQEQELDDTATPQLRIHHPENTRDSSEMHWKCPVAMHQCSCDSFVRCVAFGSGKIATSSSVYSNGDIDKENIFYDPKQHQQRCHLFNISGLLQIELHGVDSVAAAALLEYIYTNKTHFVQVENAQQVLRLCQWIGWECSLVYASLQKVITLVSIQNWMDLVLCCASLRANRHQRDQLLDELQKFMEKQGASATSDTFSDILRFVPMYRFAQIHDHDIVTRVIECFMSHFRHAEIWRKLLNGLELWMLSTFKRQEPISLMELHSQYASWQDPLVILSPREELSIADASANPTTLCAFGDYLLQIRFDCASNKMIRWRIVKQSSPFLDDMDEKELWTSSMDRSDPAFTFYGQMIVRLRRSIHDAAQQHVVTIRYTHSKEAYGKWHPMVFASSIQLQVEAADGLHTSNFKLMKAQFNGQFFAWGDRVCELYHSLLLSTLFYSSPSGTPEEMADMMVVSEMQRLPVDTLVLLLQSDQLCIPNGETKLVKVLTQLCFGSNFHRLVIKRGDEGEQPYNGTLDEIQALFRSVRWCFVDLKQILITLAQAPRALQLYQLIERSLQNENMVERCSLEGNSYRLVTTLASLRQVLAYLQRKQLP